LQNTIQSQGNGIVQYVKGGVRLAGKKLDMSSDDYLLTRGLANDTTITDFIAEFDYTPWLNQQNVDKFLFHSAGTESGCYALVMNGQLTGDKVSICVGNQYNTPLATDTIALIAGTTYHVKLSMIGKNVECYFYDKSGTIPSTPTMTVTVPDTISNPFIPSGDFNFVSNGGDYFIKNLQISNGSTVYVSNDILPTIAPAANGIIQYIQSDVRFAGKKFDRTLPLSYDVLKDDYLLTHGLIGRQDITDFVAEFDFTPSLDEWNIDKFIFHSAGEENEQLCYALIMQGTRVVGGGNITLNIGNQYYYWGIEPLSKAGFRPIPGTTYHVKLSMTGKNIECYFYDKSGIIPSTPTMTATVPDTEDNPFIPSGDFNFVDWGGDYTISNMTIMANTESEDTSSTSSSSQTSSTPSSSQTSSNSNESPETGDNGIMFSIVFLLLSAVSITGVFVAKNLNKKVK